MYSLGEAKRAVFQRDMERCTNCGRRLDGLDDGDLDHNVPQGVGGANRYGNLGTLCRLCHDAKHQQGVLAPTAQFMSTGTMTDREFAWFRHFWNEMLPALFRHVAQPAPNITFGIDNDQVWRIPIGDLMRFDEELLTAVDHYSSLKASQYM